MKVHCELGKNNNEFRIFCLQNMETSLPMICKYYILQFMRASEIIHNYSHLPIYCRIMNAHKTKLMMIISKNLTSRWHAWLMRMWKSKQNSVRPGTNYRLKTTSYLILNHKTILLHGNQRHFSHLPHDKKYAALENRDKVYCRLLHDRRSQYNCICKIWAYLGPIRCLEKW